MTPITRKEQFYNAILNGTEAPKPVTREEMYLAQIAANGGGGGGGGGGSVTKVTMTYDENDGSFTLNEEAATIFSACSNGVVLATLTMGPVEARFQIVNAFTRPAIDDPGNIYAFVTYDVTLQGFMTFQAIADDEYPVYTP